MEHIPQDYLGGDLSTKSATELKELLERQEKLLKKVKFLKTLPDGGVKVQAFVEKLQRMISERIETDLQESTNRQIISPSTKANVKPKVITEVPGQLIKKPVSKFKKQNLQQSRDVPKQNTNKNKDFSALVQNESELFSCNGEGDLHMELERNTSNSVLQRDQVTIEDIGETLEKMEISSADTDKHETPPAEEHILSVIERTHRNRKRDTLKLNRYLKISNIQDLPPELRNPSNMLAETETKQTKKKVDWEESAVCPPKYKYSAAQEMSIQESMKLQAEQTRHREESQAIYAAEKLAEKLNIKLETFNPEGRDIVYREPEVIDSDDDLEGVD
ncbi:DNA-directed RNA polymerase II subunit GRINL1A-like isoform X2 [Mytilus californianus]|uniref:DNA-directed RNA polymerase II subunit GRINL1A-like isoform X2 n=1 Tax=Mytilus californianus TaxID=6549 RepID=UPI002245436F|nr:DNA-directed RNA polymerase II subunit GRINL1A-like isoform X2 [Mytilus californianus]